MFQAGKKVKSVQRRQQGHQKDRARCEREREAMGKGKRKSGKRRNSGERRVDLRDNGYNYTLVSLQ